MYRMIHLISGSFYMTMQITKYVQKETADLWFLNRLTRSLHTVAQKRGCLAAAAMASCALSTKVYALAVAYFTAEGSLRALEDLARSNSTDIVRLRSLGDSGGWMALTIFSLFGAGTILLKLVREGEYLRIKELLKDWLESNQSVILEDPDSFKNLYLKINDLLDACQSQCLFQKSLISRRITALDLLERNPLPEECSLQRKHKALKKTFDAIKTDLEEATAMKYYFHRLYDGQRSVAKNGCGKRLGALVMGVAIPLILLTTAVMSFVGEFGLGKELFMDREELTDVGHFGEWPLNAVEALATAFFFHLWFLVNEGDFIRTRKVYKAHLGGLKDTPSSYNKVVEIANEELKDLTPGCGFFKLPGEYQIEKL